MLFLSVVPHDSASRREFFNSSLTPDEAGSHWRRVFTGTGLSMRLETAGGTAMPTKKGQTYADNQPCGLRDRACTSATWPASECERRGARHQKSPPPWRLTPPYTPLAATRDIISSKLEHSDADGKSELALVRRRLVKTSRSAAATKELGRNARNGPLVRHGPDKARNTSPGILSRRAVRLEPSRKPNNTSHRASSLPSEHQGSC